jgi:uncharacterized protein (DUF983 family)
MRKTNSNRKKNIVSIMAVSGVIMFIALGKTMIFQASTWQSILAIGLFIGGVVIANFFMR